MGSEGYESGSGKARTDQIQRDSFSTFDTTGADDKDRFFGHGKYART